MASKRTNPLSGSFRDPPDKNKEQKAAEMAEAEKEVKALDPAPPPTPSAEQKPPEQGKAQMDAKATGSAAPAKSGEEQKSAEPGKTQAEAKATGSAAPATPGEEQKPAEPGKAQADAKATGSAAPATPGEEQAPPEQDGQAKDNLSKGQKAAHTRAENEMKRHQSLIEGPNNDKLRFVKLSEIKPLPGTYVKDTPRADYSDLIDSIKKSGLEQPVILRQGENGGYQLVHGFHRCEALKQAGMLEIRADVYSMKLSEASEYRKNRDKNPPIPGTLILPHPPAPPEKEAAEPAPEKEQEPELPKNLHIPLAPEGKEETVTTAKVSDLYAFEGHPFYVNEDKDMWDLVESIKQFGVLEPVTVIPREKGGYEMVSGHRRKRACELAGITDIPVIVRHLDRDEATIAMVDANLKRENISPMERARAYQMKLDAMRRKTGRRSKSEIHDGKKPVRADQLLAEQTGESRSNIQKIVRLNNLTPELQQMVEDKKLPVFTASNLSYLKEEEQKTLADAIQKEDKVPSGTQAEELKRESQAGTLTEEKITKTVAPTKRETDPELKVTFNNDELRPYFPDKSTTVGDAKRGIFEALALRQKLQERKAAQKAETAKKPEKGKKSPAKTR